VFNLSKDSKQRCLERLGRITYMNGSETKWERSIRKYLCLMAHIRGRKAREVNGKWYHNTKSTDISKKPYFEVMLNMENMDCRTFNKWLRKRGFHYRTCIENGWKQYRTYTIWPPTKLEEFAKGKYRKEK